MDANCAGDTFVARLDGVAWPDLRAALAAGGRLALVPKGDGWTLARDPEVLRRERAALASYLEAAGRRMAGVYAPLAQEVLELEGLAQGARDARIRLLRGRAGNDPAESRRSDLIEAHFQGEGKPSTPDLVLPGVLAELPGGAPFGRLARISLVDVRSALAPGGNGLLGPLRRVFGTGPGQMETLTRDGVLLAKLPFDPISLRANLRWSVRLTSGRDVAEITSWPTVVEPPFRPAPIAPSAVWPRAELATQASRAEATRGVAPGGAFTLPAGDLRVSEALLRGARATGASLLCPVSAYTDDVVNLAGPQTLASVLSAAEGRGIAGGWYVSRGGERAWNAAPKGYEAVLRPARLRSAALAGGVLVVRDERGFLDGLCPTPTALPSPLENGLLDGKAPGLLALSEALASLRPVRWDTSVFATGYLRFGNPVRLLPFARALVASPGFRAQIAALSEDGAALETPLTRLDAAARSALAAGMEEAEPHDDSVRRSGPLDPGVTAGDWVRGAPEGYRLVT